MKLLRYGAAALGIVALVLFPIAIDNPYYIHLLETIMIYAILLFGLDIVVGYTGQVSLGHAGLFGIGAYTGGVMVMKLATPLLVTLLGAITVTAFFGAVLALPALRVTGPYLAMVTLAFGTIIQILINEMTFLTEGPLGMPKGELYFTDNRANQILLLDQKGKVSLLFDNTDNANGLALSRSGELYEVQGVGKRVNKRDKDGKVTTLSDGIGGKPFMAPNDLILNAKDGIYFTDPGPRPVVAGRKAFVYYLAPGAKDPVVADDTLVRPNGLTLAFGGRMLIVDDSVSDEVSAWDVQRDGTLKNKRTLIKLRDIPEGKESGADGMAIDVMGRLYIATITGVQVFDSSGRYLGTIKVPRQPSNVAFAGPKKATLYITAREGLYRIATLTKGPTRLGK